VTGLLTTSGSQFRDWSASYRLFSENRVPVPDIFSVIRRGIAEQLPPGAPFRAVLDDSLLRRSGLHTPGVAWRRDPLGPRFQTNFVRGQRFLQVSAAMPGSDGSFGQPNFHPADHPSAQSRSLGPRSRHREFLRLRIRPDRWPEAGKMLIPCRFRCMLRQRVTQERPKPSRRASAHKR
jgi:hypothetical protein